MKSNKATSAEAGVTFGTLLCLEAMSGRVKFGKDSEATATHMFCFEAEKNPFEVDVHKVDLNAAKKVSAKTRFYVSFKTQGGTASAVTRAGTTDKQVNELTQKVVVKSKPIIEEKLQKVYENMRQDKELLAEYNNFLKLSKGDREILVENFLKRMKDTATDAFKNKVLPLGQKVISGVKTIGDFFSRLGGYMKEAFYAIRDGIVDAFNGVLDKAKEIGQNFGFLGGLAAIGIVPEAGGDENGMIENPDVASVLMGS